MGFTGKAVFANIEGWEKTPEKVDTPAAENSEGGDAERIAALGEALNPDGNTTEEVT